MSREKQEPVVTPHDHDVLCGRGGLTNHHPGNAWYRRLVRSNRPLYRASPKHTKLLVAKAIVHHVQSQQPAGRFLECHKTTGLWYPVSYKRSVDKTSQALREKDRDGEGAADGPILASTGRTPPTATFDPIADAADRALELPPKPKITTVPPPVSGMKKSEKMSIGDNDRNENEKDDDGCNLKRPRLETTNSWFGNFMGGNNNNNNNSSSSNSSSNNNNNNRKKRQKVNDDDVIPLPTQPLEQRTSSIFRFFRSFGGGNDTQDNNNSSSSSSNNMMNSNRAMGNSNGMLNLPNDMSQYGGGGGGGGFEPRPLSQDGGFRQDHGASEAPSLTRLTTQVSDWLQSFWPLQRDDGRQDQQQTQQQAAQQQQQQQQQEESQQMIQNMFDSFHQTNKMATGGGNNGSMAMMNGMGMMNSAGMNNNMMGNNLMMMMNNGGGFGNNFGNGYNMNSMMIAHQMRQLRNNNNSSSSSSNNNNSMDGSPAQPSLRPSVSSTILQLASNPTQLFSSLSGFFGGRKSSVVATDNVNLDGGDGGTMDRDSSSSNNNSSRSSRRKNEMGTSMGGSMGPPASVGGSSMSQGSASGSGVVTIPVDLTSASSGGSGGGTRVLGRLSTSSLLADDNPDSSDEENHRIMER